MNIKLPAFAVSLAFITAASLSASAVYLNPDGKGQALIFPYYTARPANGNMFSTLLSIANHNPDAKAIRVRFREGRNGREVASFNLFLSPDDMWTGAVTAATSGPGTRVISVDLSCTSPIFSAIGSEPPALAFSNAQYVGDNFGDELDRTREGWVEVIEMATLTGSSAASVAHGNSGIPNNCGAVQGAASLSVAAPSGGLSGTLTLINVSSGEDFTVNAEALSELSTSHFYRPPSDPYPDLNAVEIDPVSVVVSDGAIWRSVWSRAADAVSAAIMRSSWSGEYILDQGTRSLTDFVVTFPTRHHYVSGNTALPPFLARCQFPTGTFSGEPVKAVSYSREGLGGEVPVLVGVPPSLPNFQCGPSGVFDLNASGGQSLTATGVFGSLNRSISAAGYYTTTYANGWFGFSATSGLSLTSLSSSTRTNISTGIATMGAHRYFGLPLVGLSARTFENGTLTCNGGTCQGNYGGAFPLKFIRSITLVP